MKYSINLMSGTEAPFTERVVYFFLNYLRYIIIITQLVVIGVFFYRFQIDQHIVDLKESVDQKKEIVQVVVPLLQQAETIDQRSNEAQKIFNEQDGFNKMIQYFLSQFPASITLTHMEFTNDSITATGNSINPHDLQSFYMLLKQDKKFGEVNFPSLKKTATGYTFQLNLIHFKG